MPPPPSRRITRYRLPVACRSREISSSGRSGDCVATSGRVARHREHAAAVLRFQMPQSGQNMSGAELKAHEIVRRPGTRELHPDELMPLALVLDRVNELLPQVALDEVGRAQNDA